MSGVALSSGHTSTESRKSSPTGCRHHTAEMVCMPETRSAPFTSKWPPYCPLKSHPRLRHSLDASLSSNATGHSRSASARFGSGSGAGGGFFGGGMGGRTATASLLLAWASMRDTVARLASRKRVEPHSTQSRSRMAMTAVQSARSIASWAWAKRRSAVASRSAAGSPPGAGPWPVARGRSDDAAMMASATTSAAAATTVTRVFLPIASPRFPMARGYGAFGRPSSS